MVVRIAQRQRSEQDEEIGLPHFLALSNTLVWINVVERIQRFVLQLLQMLEVAPRNKF